MRFLRGLFYILIGVVLTLFLWSNYEQRVVVRFTDLWRTREIPLSLALLAALLAGFVVAAILAIAEQIRLRSRLRKLRKRTEQLEAELAELRRMPLKPSLAGEKTQAAPPSAPARPATEAPKDG